LFGIISSFLLCNFLWHLLTHQSVCHLHLLSFYQAYGILLFLHYGTFWYMSSFFLTIVLQLLFKNQGVCHLHLLLFYWFFWSIFFSCRQELLYFSIFSYATKKKLQDGELANLGLGFRGLGAWGLHFKCSNPWMIL
jgi:hypothetical protein